jgi:hypothetical protein
MSAIDDELAFSKVETFGSQTSSDFGFPYTNLNESTERVSSFDDSK